MNITLMNAVLAMDAYNRGYEAGIILNSGEDSVNEETGNYTIIFESDIEAEAQGVSIGFYASAYEYDGEVIISFRGTNTATLTAMELDITNGWLLGAGNYNAAQATMAIEFYKHVAQEIDGPSADLQTVDISLTGHSLGGGLAGYIGALYGQDAKIFDSMDYSSAAGNAYFYATISTSDPQYPTIAQPLVDLIYDGNTPWAFDGSGVTAAHIEGEVLDNDFIRHTVSTLYSLGDDVTGVSSIEKHSMSTLVIRLFAEEAEVTSDAWEQSAQYLWQSMYDDNFAQSVGMDAESLAGELKNDGEFADIMRTIIAYSAVDEGTTVFGDTGIRSYYNDASDFGNALNISENTSVIRDIGEGIGEALIHFAGQLSLNKINSSSSGSAADGILALQSGENGYTLTIDLSDYLWDSILTTENHNLDTAKARFIEHFILVVDVQESSVNPERILIGLQDGETTVITEDVNVEGTVFVGTNGNDIVIDNGGISVLLGYEGDDIIESGSEADILSGGGGNDVFIGSTNVDDSGLEGDVYYGGAQYTRTDKDGADTLDYSHVNHGISFEIQNRSGTAEKRGGGGEDDVFHSIERIHGTAHDDIFDVTSGSAGYVLSGLEGDDTYVIGTQRVVIEDRWGNNTLRIEGINAEDVWLRPVGDDLVIYGNFGGAARELTRSKGHFAPSGGGGEIGDPSAGEVPQNSDAADGAQGTPSIGMIEGTDENDDPVSKNPSTDKSDYPPEGIPLKEGGDEPEYPMQGEAPSISGIPRATYDPLVLDLDGDGIEITLLNKGTYYDLDLNGMAELVSWVRPDDGFLVHDIDENGVTTDAGELFGNATSDGFAALKLLDSDANGLINVSDAAWSKLMIWQDKSGDGYADAYEMKTLAEAGIAQILLGASKSTATVNGSALTHVSSFAYTSGEFSTIANVALQVDTANSEYKGATLLGANDMLMPNLRGYGLVADLHVVSGADEDVYDAVKALEAYSTAEWFTNFADVSDEFEEMMFLWGGVSEVAHDSRGIYLTDARRLEFLEAMNDWTFTQLLGVSEDPESRQAIEIEAVFTQTKTAMMVNFLAQSSGWELFNEVVAYDVRNDALFFPLSSLTLNQDTLDALGTAGAAVSDKLAYWTEIVRFINEARGSVIAPAEETMLDQAIALTDSGLEYEDVADILGLSGELNGTSGADTLSGSPGDDVINGLGGADIIYGGAGNDVIDGGDGDDEIYGEGGFNHLIGGNGNDGLRGGDGQDLMEGGEGDDTYALTKGDDVLLETGEYSFDAALFEVDYANVTDVTLKRFGFSDLSIEIELVNTADNINALIVDQYISGSFGQIDTLWVGEVEEGTLYGEAFDLTEFTSDMDMLDNIYGHEIGETIDGRGYINSLSAGHTIYAGGGDDTVYTTALDDIVYGGDGNDIIYGGDGYNILRGEAGNDVIEGGGGDDTIYLGDGDDILLHSGIETGGGEANGHDTVTDGGGIDVIRLTGSGYSINHIGFAKVNSNKDLRIYEGGSTSIITIKDHFNGKPIEFLELNNGVRIDLVNNNLMSGNGYNNTLTGTSGADLMNGLDGNDTLNGGDGNDTLRSGSGQDTVNGGNGDDLILGDDGVDTLNGDDGNDIIYGGEDLSADTINGGAGADVIYGEGGADALRGDMGADTILGGAGNDVIHGDSQSSSTGDDDILYGEAGNDDMYGNGGNDTLFGGDGDDELYGQDGDDILSSGNGTDILDGGAGNDTAQYLFNTVGVSASLLTNTADKNGDTTADDTLSGIENLRGSHFNDTITGDANANRLYGEGGVDTINGGDGDDTLNGGAGADILDGGDGTDVADYSGMAAFVVVDLEAGTSDENDDAVADDTLTSIENAKGSSHNDTLTGSSAVNSLYGGAGADLLNGAGGDDALYGEDGDDTLIGGAGSDDIDGGDGQDTVDYSANAAAVVVDLTAGTADENADTVTDDTLTSIENVKGTAYNDTITGDAEDNILEGLGGTDILYGGDGADVLHGGDGNDVLWGDAGNDVLYGGAGNDTIHVGTGNDHAHGGLGSNSYDNLGGGDTVYHIAAGASADYIYETSGGDDVVVLPEGVGFDDIAVNLSADLQDIVITVTATSQAIHLKRFFWGESYQTETVALFDGSDTASVLDLLGGLHGTASTETLYGDGDDNVIYGYAGADTIYGGNGDDVIHGHGGNDVLYGENGDDTLYGGDANDTLQGGADDDHLYGGGGSNVMSGWGGHDRFYIAATAGTETLYDYNNPDDVDSVVFLDAGTEFSDLSASRFTNVNPDDSIRIDIAGSSRVVNLMRVFWGSGYEIEKLVFADNDEAYVSSLFAVNTINGTAAGETINGTAFFDDVIYGGDGDDILYGNSGQDTLYGEDGNDTLHGQSGENALYGGAGNDIYALTKNAIGNVVIEESGNDTILLWSGVTTLESLNWAQDGDDLLLTIDGAGGTTRITDYYADSDSKVENLAFATGEQYRIADLISLNIMVGTSGADTIYGTSAADLIEGYASNDVVYGGAGDDVIYGNSGTDTLWGDDGNDWIYGGGDQDTMQGGAGDDHLFGMGGNNIYSGWGGHDSFYIDGASLLNSIYDYNNPNDVDTIVFLDPDVSFGDLSASLLTNTNPNDSIKIEVADSSTIVSILRNFWGNGYEVEKIRFANGDEAYTSSLFAANTVNGTSSSETLNGTAFYDDIIHGDDGNDTLYGNTGQDHLYGEGGYDVLWGQGGADTFYITDTVDADLIQDFSLAQDDKLNLDDVIDYDSGLSDDIDDFLRFVTDGVNGGNDIEIRQDGTGSWIKAADLMGSDLSASTLDDLIASGHLIVE